MQIAIVLYDRFTALDAVGPYETLGRLPDADTVFVAERTGPVRSDTGRLALTADRSLAEVPHPDIVVVPGGPGQSDQMDNPVQGQFTTYLSVGTEIANRLSLNLMVPVTVLQITGDDPSAYDVGTGGIGGRPAGRGGAAGGRPGRGRHRARATRPADPRGGRGEDR